MVVPANALLPMAHSDAHPHRHPPAMAPDTSMLGCLLTLPVALMNSALTHIGLNCDYSLSLTH